SSSGIGAGTAVLFAKEGAKVTITGRKQDGLEVNNAGGMLRDSRGVGGVTASVDVLERTMDLNVYR
ncbi:hypothetical protein ANCDUO_08480, partial [Ancylostoma duodenale]